MLAGEREKEKHIEETIVSFTSLHFFPFVEEEEDWQKYHIESYSFDTLVSYHC